MPGAAGRAGLGDEIERIGDARILGVRPVVEIGQARCGSRVTFSITVPKRSVVA